MDDIIRQTLFIDAQMRDPKTTLRFHRWDESNKMAWADPESGCCACFWGQGLGLYAMALTDLLDHIPLKHPQRQKLVFIVNDLCQAILDFQDFGSDLWFQVPDQGDRPGNFLETAGSSMFVYALAKAFHQGYVDKTYWTAAEKAYQALLNQMITVDPDGLVNLTQISGRAGLDGQPSLDCSFAYYIKSPQLTNDLIGVSAFILASLQIEQNSYIPSID